MVLLEKVPKELSKMFSKSFQGELAGRFPDTLQEDFPEGIGGGRNWLHTYYWMELMKDFLSLFSAQDCWSML